MNNMTDNIILENNYPKDGIVTCFSCKQQMPIEEGIIIFGDKWFHDACWNKNNGIKNV